MTHVNVPALYRLPVDVLLFIVSNTSRLLFGRTQGMFMFALLPPKEIHSIYNDILFNKMIMTQVDDFED